MGGKHCGLCPLQRQAAEHLYAGLRIFGAVIHAGENVAVHFNQAGDHHSITLSDYSASALYP